MRPIGGKPKRDYEQVAVDEWIPGIIESVQYDEARPYKAMNKETGKPESRVAPHVRFRFALEGYQFPHYSRWLRASTFEKSNLYGKFLKYLCPIHDCKDQLIDLDKLVGIKIKTMWAHEGEYTNLAQIRGLNPDLNIIIPETATATPTAPTDDAPPVDYTDADIPAEDVPL